ncbi:MAG: hypothetical protein NC320_09000 [Clostridium sp.]|nr:hypothetical protein [Clostridium sp.]MCM1547936.1 hypothetical protein [Ruminococcus sp.]
MNDVKIDETIYAPQNKYGYKINVNHQRIRPLYEAYKKKLGAIILSDKERFHFEYIIFQMIERKRATAQDISQ